MRGPGARSKLMRLLLTKREAEALMSAAGNSVADPDWWNSYGKGQRGAFGRAVGKVTQQRLVKEQERIEACARAMGRAS